MRVQGSESARRVTVWEKKNDKSKDYCKGDITTRIAFLKQYFGLPYQPSSGSQVSDVELIHKFLILWFYLIRSLSVSRDLTLTTNGEGSIR